MKVLVIDSENEKPVDRARVWLLTGEDAAAYRFASHAPSEVFTKINGPIERFGSRVITDKDGRTTILSTFEASGDFSMKSDTTSTFVTGFVIVERWDYERFEGKLEELLPKYFRLRTDSTIAITIRLKKANPIPEPKPYGSARH